VGERMGVNISVVCEIVCKTIITTVAITKYDKLARIIKGNDFSSRVRLI
jgi:hypothetical protein